MADALVEMMCRKVPLLFVVSNFDHILSGISTFPCNLIFSLVGILGSSVVAYILF